MPATGRVRPAVSSGNPRLTLDRLWQRTCDCRQIVKLGGNRLAKYGGCGTRLDSEDEAVAVFFGQFSTVHSFA